MEKERRLRKEYNKILKNFLPNDLDKACITSFGSEIWNDIRKSFKKKGNLSKKELAEVVDYIFRVMDYAYLIGKLSYIQLSDVLLHSRKRTWYSFELCGDKNKGIFCERGLKKDLISSFQQKRLKYDVTVIMFDEVAWIRMALPSSRVGNALYLAYFIGEGFLFLNKSLTNINLMEAIASALKYKSLKKLSLYGKDIWSLLKILKQKESKALQMSINLTTDRNQAENIHSSFGVDYTKGTMRKAEIERCLGVNPPVLQSFTIKSESGLRVGRVLSEMDGYPCKVKVQFSHPDLYKFLIEAAERNAITQPLPRYMKHFPINGRNVIILKDTPSRDKSCSKSCIR